MTVSPVAPTLGTHIQTRRTALTISQARAARIAHVSRTTWRSWEEGATPEDYNFPKIELVCQWEAGSVKAILEGRAPTPLRPQPAASDIPAPPLGYDLERWRQLDPVDREMVLAAIRIANAQRETQNPPKERHPNDSA